MKKDTHTETNGTVEVNNTNEKATINKINEAMSRITPIPSEAKLRHEMAESLKSARSPLTPVRVIDISPILQAPTKDALIIGWVNPERTISNYKDKDVNGYKYVEIPAYDRIKGYIANEHFN